MQAAAWLVNTSALYQEQGVTLDENWMTSIEQKQFLVFILMKIQMVQMIKLLQKMIGVKMKQKYLLV